MADLSKNKDQEAIRTGVFQHWQQYHNASNNLAEPLLSSVATEILRVSIFEDQRARALCGFFSGLSSARKRYLHFPKRC